MIVEFWWAIHNLVAHPLSQLLWLASLCGKRGDAKAVQRLEFEHGKQQLDALEASGGKAQ